MFVVGIEQRSQYWRYISDGVTAYITNGDFRRSESCKPPELKIWDDLDDVLEHTRPSYKSFGNQVGLVDLFQDINSISLHGLSIVNSTDATNGTAIKLAAENGLDLHNGIATENANPKLNGLLKKISAWFSGLDQIEVSMTFQELHKTASNLHVSWLNYDRDVGLIRAASEARERKIWDRYWKLRDLASLDDLPGMEFERAIASLYTTLGYETRLTKATGDFGVDLIAVKNSHRYAIQVKRYSANVGVSAVQQVVAGAKLYQANNHAVVTNSLFTNAAKVLAREHSVELVDRNELASMWKIAYPSSIVPPYSAGAYKKIRTEILGALTEENASNPKVRRRGNTAYTKR